MPIAPALLEDWFRSYYHEARLDIGSSGVHSYSFTELRELANIHYPELDAIVFDDSHSCGAPGLRQAIANRWGSGDPEWVMATHGSSEAIYLIMNALLRPGDEVIALDPCYHSLNQIAEAIGCRLTYWRLRAERQFAPDIDELRSLINRQTRMIVVNFPHNPTGATITQAEQSELIALAEAAGAYLVWDAAFAELSYASPPLPEPTARYDRAISFGTLSKAYGLPGLRVGWCLAAPELLEACVRLRDYITLALSPMVELVAQRAIEHGDRLLAPRLQQARTNLALLEEWAAEHQALLEWYPPSGGVTAFPRLRQIQNSEPLCHALVQRHGVLLVPGTCFDHPQHVRLGFGGPTPQFQQGLKHLSDLLVEAATSEAARSSPGAR